MASATPETSSEVPHLSKIYYGVFKHQLVAPVCEEDEVDADDAATTSGDKTSKKKKSKSKESSWAKKQKADPHAPPTSRVPLPEMSDAVKSARQNAMSEISRRVKLCPEKLPSICFYTFLNAHNGVCCAEISEDSSILSAGFNDSTVQLWALSDDKLKPLKKASELDKLDKDADDILDQILDESNESSRLTFIGHNGPVYSTSFSPDKKLLISCSEDGTVRLWSLQTWSNLVVYRLSMLPFWDVKFGPYGHYFASAGADHCALLWTLDRQQPLRLFCGHTSDVNCVNFHPNSNYVVSGSSDKSVRLWDVTNGECVRHLTGHTTDVHSVQFSSDGRILASGSSDGHVILWDIAQGRILLDMPAHDSIVHSLAFSRDNTVLATGGMDNKVALHYLTAVQNDLYGDSPQTKQSLAESVQMPEYPTKSTPIQHLHFTRKNLLLGVGSYGQ